MISPLFLHAAHSADIKLIKLLIIAHPTHILSQSERADFWDAIFCKSKTFSKNLGISEIDANLTYVQLLKVAGSPFSAYSSCTTQDGETTSLKPPYGALFDTARFWQHQQHHASAAPIFHWLCSRLILDTDLPLAVQSIYQKTNIHLAATLLEVGRLDILRLIADGIQDFNPNIVVTSSQAIHNVSYEISNDGAYQDTHYLHQFTKTLEGFKLLKKYGLELDYTKLQQRTNPSDSALSFPEFLIHEYGQEPSYISDRIENIDEIFSILQRYGHLTSDAKKTLVSTNFSDHPTLLQKFLDITPDEWCTPIDRNLYSLKTKNHPHALFAKLYDSDAKVGAYRIVFEHIRKSWNKNISEHISIPVLTEIISSLLTYRPNSVSDFLKQGEIPSSDEHSALSITDVLCIPDNLRHFLLKCDEYAHSISGYKVLEVLESCFSITTKIQPDALFIRGSDGVSTFSHLLSSLDKESTFLSALIHSIPTHILLQQDKATRSQLITHLFKSHTSFSSFHGEVFVMKVAELLKQDSIPPNILLNLSSILHRKGLCPAHKAAIESAILYQQNSATPSIHKTIAL